MSVSADFTLALVYYITCMLCGVKTESEDIGLVSADRNSKATLLLTAPCPCQVVCEGFSAGKHSIWLAGRPIRLARRLAR